MQGLWNGRASLCRIIQPPHAAAAGLLLSAVWVGDINRQRRAPAPSSKCEQSHVDSWRRELNTDFLIVRATVVTICWRKTWNCVHLQKNTTVLHFALPSTTRVTTTTILTQLLFSRNPILTRSKPGTLWLLRIDVFATKIVVSDAEEALHENTSTRCKQNWAVDAYLTIDKPNALRDI